MWCECIRLSERPDLLKANVEPSAKREGHRKVAFFFAASPLGDAAPQTCRMDRKDYKRSRDVCTHQHSTFDHAEILRTNLARSARHSLERVRVQHHECIRERAGENIAEHRGRILSRLYNLDLEFDLDPKTEALHLGKPNALVGGTRSARLLRRSLVFLFAHAFAAF